MSSYEHWDVSSAQSTGYASYQNTENRDGSENRAKYLDEYQDEIFQWLKDAYPEILEEFSEHAKHYGALSYDDWLN